MRPASADRRHACAVRVAAQRDAANHYTKTKKYSEGFFIFVLHYIKMEIILILKPKNKRITPKDMIFSVSRVTCRKTDQ